MASATLSASTVDGPAVLSLRARDSRSGLPIDGVVADIGSGELRVAMSDDGTMRTTLDPGRRDLELRGPGELLGTRQTGLMRLRVADLLRDSDLLPTVIAISEELLATSPAAIEPLIRRWVRGEAEYAKV